MVTQADLQRLQASRMRESDLQEAVRQLAVDTFGLLYQHAHNSQRSYAGFPDCTIAGTRVIFRELKTMTGRPTPEQKIWLDWIEASGGDADIWNPMDLLTGRIRKELEAIRWKNPPTAETPATLAAKRKARKAYGRSGPANWTGPTLRNAPIPPR